MQPTLVDWSLPIAFRAAARAACILAKMIARMRQMIVVQASSPGADGTGRVLISERRS